MDWCIVCHTKSYSRRPSASTQDESASESPQLEGWNRIGRMIGGGARRRRHE